MGGSMVGFEDIRNVALVGAGTMGAGISVCFAQAGYEVTLYSRSAEGIQRALGRVRHSQEVFIQEELISRQDAEAARARIQGTTSLEKGLQGAHFVLESIPEDLALKQRVFREMEPLCCADAILATNTSGLSITAIASVCKRPERVGGMHWVNPAEIVPLVEVVRGEKTADGAVDVICKVAEKLGKVPVVVRKDVPGFASNRLQAAVFREALHLVEAGIVTPEDVDKILKNGVGFRYPWLGPLETADLGGLEVFHAICVNLFGELSTMTEPPAFFSDMVQSGNLGIKSGQGFYDYAGKSREDILRRRDLYFIRQAKLIREIMETKPLGRKDTK